jgi:hypothetical protein
LTALLPKARHRDVGSMSPPARATDLPVATPWYTELLGVERSNRDGWLASFDNLERVLLK